MVFVKSYRSRQLYRIGAEEEEGVDHVDTYGCITNYSTGGWVTITLFLEVVWMDDGTPVFHPIHPRYTIKARRDRKLVSGITSYWPSSGNFYTEVTDPKIHPEYDDDILEKLWNQNTPYLNA